MLGTLDFPYAVRRVLPFVCALGMGVFSIGAQGRVVAPSQFTPSSIAPTPPVDFQASEAAESSPEINVPSGAKSIFVRLRRIEVTGEEDGLEEGAQTLKRPLEGRTVSVAELYQFVAALQKLYAQAGYVLARVVVPKQQVSDGGDFKVVIVQGFIEKVVTRGMDPSVRELVVERTRHLVGRRDVTLKDIERVLMIAGNLPGVTLQSALVRGEQEGGVQLVLAAQQKTVTGTIGPDNRLPDSLGTWQLGASMAFNNLLGQGEQIYVSSGLGLGGGTPLHQMGGGVIFPIGQDGLTFNPEYIDSETRTESMPGVLATRGGFKRLALRLSYPLIFDHSRNLNLTGSFESIDQHVDASDFGVELSRDRYQVLRVGMNWSSTRLGNIPPLVGSIQLSKGLSGRDFTDVVVTGVPLSRQDAKPTFSKVDGEIRMIKPISGGLNLSLTGRGQVSFSGPLFVSEQFSLDGAGGISTTSSGTFNVDSGVTARVELAYPISIQNGGGVMTFSPYVFGAAGMGRNWQATAVEQGSVNAAAYGVGVRFARNQGSFGSESLGLEVGRLHSNLEGARSSTRFVLVGAVSF